jgi:putative selenate reductase FAD-binding subunit
MIRQYHAPATVDDAVALRERLGGSAVFLAGGTEVNSAAFPFVPEHVISLEHLGLTGISVTRSELILGACCTIQQIIDSADVPDCIKSAAGHVCNRNIRNMATIGGQFGSNKSCGNLLPILVALEAAVDVAAPGATFAIPALQYITEERKEMITLVRIRTSAFARFSAVEKYSRTTNDLSIITAAVTLAREGDAVVSPLIAAGGLARHVIRLEAVEQALHGNPPPNRDAIERLVAAHVSPIADIRGSVEFKKHIAGVLVANTVLRAFRQGGGEGR